jgi:two-component system, cell cycle response regulator
MLATSTVVWVARSDSDPSLLAAELARNDYAVVRASPGKSIPVAADVRVLAANCFESISELANEYHADPQPTLVVVGSAEEAALVLDFLRDADDVVVLDGDVASRTKNFLRRLARVDRLARAAQQLRSASSKDSLTGLENRASLDAEGARWCEDNLGASHRALLVLDGDYLKGLNDRFGHREGDRALVEIAGRMRVAASKGDCLFRHGGDEFAVLLSRATREEVVVAAQRIRNSAGMSPISLAVPGRHGLTLTLSGGVTFLTPGRSFAQALGEADKALYAAKAAGRDRLVSYESLLETAAANEQDIGVLNFQNVTKVVTERVTNLVTLFGKGLLEEAQRQAKTDALTTLKNRRYFDERIAREVELARKDGRKLSIAMLDLDHFGRFNKTFGEPTGDLVLKTFAEVASASIRSTDWLARYGGEEFCLVVPGDMEDAKMIAERVRGNLAAQTIATDEDGPLSVTVSIGVAEFSSDVATPVHFVKKASQALREAKRLGRNQVYGKS